VNQVNDLVARLWDALDREAALGLWRGAIGRESITGNEANFVAYLEDQMRALGLSNVSTAEFLPGRPNIWGERKGRGGGKRLLFIGHTDTVHVEGWREHWAGTEREDPFGAPVIDGAVWGRGAGDLKAGICASLAALAVLEKAGIDLAGDVSFAFVGDEESGRPGTGVSAGIKDFVTRIESGEVAAPDFVVYVEPTRLSIYPAQIGFFIADITITGKSAYFGVPELGKDALRASHSVMTALWKHSDEIAARAEHPLVGRGFLLITGLTGGGYIAVPERCTLSLIRKLLPGESLDTAAAEIEAAVRGAIVDPEITVEFAYPAGRDHALGGTACEIDEQMPEVAMLSATMAEAMMGRGPIEGAPFWSEVPFFVNRLSVPAVYCAPGDIRNCHTHEEHVDLEEYFAGIVGFAAFIAGYCGVRNELRS
jgi:acetylornithine deacetylase